ncbi:MAG: Peptidase protein [Patescibacteria group bacterium]|nr:Peptidase protein [Patescibacteria group bacterium]
MNKLLKNTVVSFFLFVFIVGMLAPDVAFARHRGGSSLQNKINDLGNDRVDDLPVPLLFGTTPNNIVRNFGDPRSGGRKHEGLDIMAPKGTPIASPTEAVVTRIGEGDSAGLYVYTANPGGESMAYMHLDSFADIDEGDVLKVGEIIGYVGNTGNAISTAPHLHYELHDDDGDAVDPFPRLTKIFILKDKIESLLQALDEMNDEDDEEVLINFVVSNYKSELLLAQSLGIVLPTEILDSLVKKVAVVSGIARTLKLGMVGDDVKAMQSALGINPDGTFGPKTKSAVITFQISKGLTADGVFGPASRAILLGSTSTLIPGCTATTLYSPISGAKCR